MIVIFLVVDVFIAVEVVVAVVVVVDDDVVVVNISFLRYRTLEIVVKRNSYKTFIGGVMACVLYSCWYISCYF